MENNQVPKILTQDFRIRIILCPDGGPTYDDDAVRDFVAGFVRKLSIGETLSHTELSIAILKRFRTVVNVHVQVPNDDVIPASDERILAGRIWIFQGSADDLEASMKGEACRIQDVLIVEDERR